MHINSTQNQQVYGPKKVAKTVAKTVLVAGLAATGLALGAKSGKFAVTEESSALAKKVLPYLEKAGNFINTQAKNVYEGVKIRLQKYGQWEKVQAGVKKIKEGFKGIGEKVKTGFKGFGEKAQAGIKKGGEFLTGLLGKLKGMFAKAPEAAKQAAETLV